MTTSVTSRSEATFFLASPLLMSTTDATQTRDASDEPSELDVQDLEAVAGGIGGDRPPGSPPPTLPTDFNPTFDDQIKH